WGWARAPAFDMADWLRQSKRAHHALEKSASGNGRAESLTLKLSRRQQKRRFAVLLVLDAAWCSFWCAMVIRTR
ncbi:hypothetical protein ACTJLC_28855, partial [Paraburkholderia sp. 22099]|uniref:hypothetical protein n=1 Tax=Paraburkholderia sp. 22099 TaxID=3453875 RepID=UPI003F85AC96